MVYAGHVLAIFTQLSPEEKHFVFRFRCGMNVSWAALVRLGEFLTRAWAQLQVPGKHQIRNCGIFWLT